MAVVSAVVDISIVVSVDAGSAVDDTGAWVVSGGATGAAAVEQQGSQYQRTVTTPSFVHLSGHDSVITHKTL